jgi:predicted ATPase/DNA-binding CsgD family transcriptional regulator
MVRKGNSPRSQRADRGLPAQLTSFVGREREVNEVRRRLSEARLVTLIGTGGVGKTRLALTVAAGVRRGFVDGVRFVDLTPLTDEALLGYAVADALGIHEQSGRPPSEIVIDFLRDRQLLLVLDSCEHVLDSAARFAADVLPAAPGLRMLCTSRQPLGIIGEHLWEVPPLELPEPGQRLPADAQVRFAAVALFAERALAVAPDLAMTPELQSIVVEVCRNLDGLPLAIELAAAQLGTVSVHQLAALLQNRVGMLAIRHAVPRRHRTLEETFDWSFELCSPEERELWVRLSVFVGSFTYEAAAHVYRDDGESNILLGPLTGLIDQSILTHSEQMRYRLLDTVRQYGLRKLRSAGADQEAMLRQRHRDWYLGLTERFAAAWFGPDQVAWLDRLRLEHANLRSALTYCLSAPDQAQAGLKLATGMRYFWVASGGGREGRYWLERALAADTTPTPARVDALSAYCNVLATTSNHLVAAGVVREEMELATRLGDPLRLVTATSDLGINLFFTDNHAEARVKLEESFKGFTDLGVVDAHTCIVRLTTGITALWQGEIDAASAICAEVRALCEQRSDGWVMANALIISAMIEMARRDLEKAGEHLREGLRLSHTLGDVRGLTTCFDMSAHLAVAAGAFERAATLHGAAHRWWSELGRMTDGPSPFRERMKQLEACTKEALGDAAFDRAYGLGGGLTLDDVVFYALGEKPPRPPRSPAEQPDDSAAGLTRRELQIAELVSQGLSNREMAARLVISQRTAESHVEHILTKLGFNSRAQIAAWVAQRKNEDLP